MLPQLPLPFRTNYGSSVITESESILRMRATYGDNFCKENKLQAGDTARPPISHSFNQGFVCLSTEERSRCGEETIPTGLHVRRQISNVRDPELITDTVR